MNQQNPYDFITNQPTKQKRSLLPGGNSKNGRIIIVAAGAVLLLLLIIIFISVLNSGSTALKADYTKLAQQQTEIIRVSQLGTTKAQRPETKNLAITSQLSLTSQQTSLLEIAKKAGANTSPAGLSAGKDTETDEALTAAEQANKFDEEFSAILIAELQEYQKQLKKLYDATENSTTKAALSKAYNDIDNLLASVSTPD